MNAPIPPFKSLLAFDSAARLGSFSQAAEELSVTQSAISQQLFKLEELLGQKLFVRKGKGVELTAAGELLHETVRETLARLSAGLDRIAPYKNKNSLLISCQQDFRWNGNSTCAGPSTRFLGSFPQVNDGLGERWCHSVGLG